MEHKELSKQTMEELTADYAFGKLSANEKSIYEANLHKYPELQQEIQEIKSVFSKVDEMDFNNILAQRARNISVKVQAQRVKKLKKEFNMEYLFKYVIPSAGIFSLMVIAYFVNENNYKKEMERARSIQYNMQILSISNQDLLKVNLKTNNSDEIDAYFAETASYDNVAYLQMEDEDAMTQLSKLEEEKLLNTLSNSTMNSPNTDIINEIKSLSESEILQILGEMSDVEFDS